MRRNWPFFKDSDWLILVFVHSAKPTAELENLAMSPSLSSPGLSYDTKFVHIGWELRSSLVGDTILGVQSEPACNTRRVGFKVRLHAITRREVSYGTSPDSKSSGIIVLAGSVGNKSSSFGMREGVKPDSATRFTRGCTGRSAKYGLPVFRCSRGTCSNESLHKGLSQVLGGHRTAPQLANSVMVVYNHRRNHRTAGTF